MKNRTNRWAGPLALIMTLPLVGCEGGTPAPDPSAKRPALTRSPGTPGDTTTAAAATTPPPPPPTYTPKVVFEKDSTLHKKVFVVDEGPVRALRFGAKDSDDQDAMSAEKKDGVEVLLEHQRIALLGMVFVPEPKRVLVIGLGGGTFPKLLAKHYPEVKVEVVEPDAVVVEAAKTHFGVSEGGNLSITVADPAAFVTRAQAGYDVVLHASHGAGMREELTTTDLFRNIQRKLSDPGVVVMNLGVSLEDEINMERRFREVFEDVRCARGLSSLNVVFFGRGKEGGISVQTVVDNARQASIDHKLPFELSDPARRVQFDCRTTR